MEDSSQKLSHKAGEAKGQAQEKGSNMLDSVSNTAECAKGSAQEAGAEAKTKAHGAVEAVKDAIGMNK